MAKAKKQRKSTNEIVKNIDGGVELVIEQHRDSESATVSIWGKEQGSGLSFYVYNFYSDSDNKVVVKQAEAVISALQKFVAEASKVESNRKKS